MDGTEFINIFNASGVSQSEVYKLCINDPRFDKEAFRKLAPKAFNYEGKLNIKFEDHKSYYSTFCPLPTHPKVQENGDAFVVHNQKHSFYCYGGCTDDKPLNVVQFVMCLILGVSPEVAAQPKLSKMFFWPAVRFLVKHFGKRIGVSFADVSSKQVYKVDVKQRILQATVDYYHFLATEVEKHVKRIDEYYLEKRFFKYVYTNEEFQEHKKSSKMGITPVSKENDMLYKKLKSLKFSDKDILDARVCIRLADGRIIDTYRNHAILPYQVGDRITGLYGKNFDKNAQVKHFRLAGHYKEQPSLHKIVNSEEFYVVEGDNTKEALKALGYTTVIETMGSNGFKDEHAAEIGRYREASPKKLKVAYAVYDPDDTGRKATLKMGRKLQNISKVQVKVIRMPVLEKDGKPWHLDVNDLFEEYREKAGEVFEKLKKNAISLDAFTFLYLLEKEEIYDYIDARTALQRHVKYFDYVPKIERLFVMEELIDLLLPAFKDFGYDRSEIRSDLKALFLDRPELKRTEKSQKEEEENLRDLGLLDEDEENEENNEEKVNGEEDLRDDNSIDKEEKIHEEPLDESEGVAGVPPVIGFEVFEKPTGPMWALTQNEELYEKYKPHLKNLLLVNDFRKIRSVMPRETKAICCDIGSFTDEQIESINGFPNRFYLELEDKDGNFSGRYFRDKDDK